MDEIHIWNGRFWNQQSVPYANAHAICGLETSTENMMKLPSDYYPSTEFYVFVRLEPTCTGCILVNFTLEAEGAEFAEEIAEDFRQRLEEKELL